MECLLLYIKNKIKPEGLNYVYAINSQEKDTSWRIVCVIVVILLTSSLFGQEDGLNVIFKQDFENTTIGPYQRDEWLSDWNNPNWENRLANAEIHHDPEISNVLKLTYLKGTVGLNEDSSPTPGNGLQFWTHHPGQNTEMYLSYNVIFKEGFVFNMAGKLPGLLGGDQDYIPNTKPEWDEGWSCMVTWDGQVLNSSGKPIAYYPTTYPGLNDPSKGTINYYFYHQDQPNMSGDIAKWVDPYSEDVSKPWYIIDNNTKKWINITVRVVMNTIGPDGGNYDGIMEGFIDGKLMTSKTNIRWRNISTAYIDGILFASFFGGSGDVFAAKRDEWAYFDDFYLFTYASREDVPRGNTPSPTGRILKLPNLRYENDAGPVKDTEPPTAPSGLSIDEVSENSVELSWNASTDNVKVTGYSIDFTWDNSTNNTGVKGYRIWLNGSEIGTGTSNNYAVSGLTPDTEYRIALAAYDYAGNESQRTSEFTVRTGAPDRQAPSVPEGLITTIIGETSVGLAWSPSVDNVTVTDLTPGLDYKFSAMAFDEASNTSAQSAELYATTKNPDLTTEQTLPELAILEISNNAKAISELKSTGFTELEDYGMLISTNRESILEGEVFYAQAEDSEIKYEGRVTQGLQLLYDFIDGDGNKVSDRSFSGEPFDLVINKPLNT